MSARDDQLHRASGSLFAKLGPASKAKFDSLHAGYKTKSEQIMADQTKSLSEKKREIAALDANMQKELTVLRDEVQSSDFAITQARKEADSARDAVL